MLIYQNKCRRAYVSEISSYQPQHTISFIDSIAVRPPSISASSTMGGATLLGTCLTGLQGLRGPLGWDPAEAPVPITSYQRQLVLTSLTGSRGALDDGTKI